jgi:GT2 family glycosyltransferase
MKVDISVIIVSFNTAGLLADCIRSVQQSDPGLSIEIIVVDNNSHDGSQAMLKRDFPMVTLVENTCNKGFAQANNQGLQKAQGDMILLLNPDTEVFPSTLLTLRRFLVDHPHIGAVGPRTYLDKTCPLQVCSLKLLTPLRALILFTRLPFPGRKRRLKQIWHLDGLAWETDSPIPVEGIGGAAIMMTRKRLLNMGGLDERFFMGYEDTDLAARLKHNGTSVVYHPDAHIVHLFGQSKQQPDSPEQTEYAWHKTPSAYLRKHHGIPSLLMLKAAKCLDHLIPSGIKNHPSPGHIRMYDTNTDLILEIPTKTPGPYLFEISNDDLFYDKFALITTEPACTIPATLIRRLAGQHWHWRAFQWPMTQYPDPLISGTVLRK